VVVNPEMFMNPIDVKGRAPGAPEARPSVEGAPAAAAGGAGRGGCFVAAVCPACDHLGLELLAAGFPADAPRLVCRVCGYSADATGQRTARGRSAAPRPGT
jgi:hypothetical protein